MQYVYNVHVIFVNYYTTNISELFHLSNIKSVLFHHSGRNNYIYLIMRGEEIKKKRNELNLTQEELGRILGVSKRTIINYEKGKIIPDSKIELLHNFIHGNKANDQINVGSNIGNIAGNNFVQVTLPDKGTQKIIKPDGTIEITSAALNDQSYTDSSTNNRLREKIEDMERLIKSLQDTIKAKDETIEILRSQITK